MCYTLELFIIDLFKQAVGGKATWERELFVKPDTEIATGRPLLLVDSLGESKLPFPAALAWEISECDTTEALCHSTS